MVVLNGVCDIISGLRKRNISIGPRILLLLLTIVSMAALCGCELLVLLEYEPAASPSENYQIKVVMLDVGQGDSILLASDGQYMLVDAGENDRGDDVVAALKDMGVTRLSAVIGTHPHSDHIGGMDTVINSLPVEQVFLPRLTADTETYEDLLDAIDDVGLSITVPQPGDTMELGQAEVEFLWPAEEYESDNDNNHSIVLMISAGGRKVMLCGDIEKKAEASLVEQGIDLYCDVLKVAHHGSDTSSTEAFLEAAHPRIALISVGQGNSYKHPDKDVLRRLKKIGATIYRTDQHETVTVTVKDGEIEVNSQ